MAFDGITIDLGSIDHIEGEPGEAKFLPGPQGPQGETGATGPTGVSVTDVSVERTSGTGAAGTTDTYTGTVTFSDSTTTTFVFDVYNGEDGTNGQDGAAATIAVGNVTSGSDASVTNSGTSSAAVFDFVLPKGDKGDTGNTGAQGVSVSSVSVARTSGTGAAGTTDTYTGTVTFSNSTTSTFTFSVYNGADGQGAGDMLKSVYDTDNDGVVDNAEALGGQSPDYYAKATNGIYYAKTAGNGVAQVATIPGITQYYDGLCVALIFNVATSRDATININNLGAVPLRDNTDASSTTNTDSIYSPGGAMRIFVYDSANSLFRGVYDYSTRGYTHFVPTTGSAAAKQADRITQNSNYFHAPCYQLVYFNFDNTAQSALTLGLWNGPYAGYVAPIYINGEASSATNYTLPKGLYLVLWDGTNYYVNTNGTLPGTQAPLTFDSAPTQNSNNPVTSGGVYDALAPLRSVDAAPTPDSTNLVQSGGVASAVGAVSNAVSRRNLLDNWYFVGGGSQQGGGQFPINQRGNTSYNGAVYGIDRWKGANAYGNIAVQSDGLQLNSVANAFFAIDQIIENGATNLNGKTVTLSVLLPSGDIVHGSATLNLTGTSQTFIQFFFFGSTGIAQVNASTSEVSVRLRVQNNLTVKVAAIKLELGDTQTLAHNEGTADAPVWVLNDIPNFAEELVKCQYYFERVKYVTGNTSIATGTANGTYLYFPVKISPKRTACTISLNGTIKIGQSSAGESITGLYSSGTAQDPASGHIHLAVQVASAVASSGEAWRLILTNGSYIDFSADL